MSSSASYVLASSDSMLTRLMFIAAITAVSALCHMVWAIDRYLLSRAGTGGAGHAAGWWALFLHFQHSPNATGTMPGVSG